MTEETARTIIEGNTRSNLIPEEVDLLLSMFVTSEPSETGADDGAWSINRASERGWLWLAGDEKARMDFRSDGGDFKASQPRAFCLEMAAYFRRLADSAGEEGSDSNLELVCMEVGC
jgi:hypothetical protein